MLTTLSNQYPTVSENLGVAVEQELPNVITLECNGAYALFFAYIEATDDWSFFVAEWVTGAWVQVAYDDREELARDQYAAFANTPAVGWFDDRDWLTRA